MKGILMIYKMWGVRGENMKNKNFLKILFKGYMYVCFFEDIS